MLSKTIDARERTAPTSQRLIDASLRVGYTTIPSSWVRPPLELSKLSSREAEDQKMLGALHGLALFNTKIAGPEVAQLWSLTSKILHICFNPLPLREDVEELKQASQASLDLFAKIFHHSEDPAYCFTPTTHGITHLYQNLSQCGPLLNLSQCVVEGLVGELSARGKSRKHPETQMLSLYCNVKPLSPPCYALRTPPALVSHRCELYKPSRFILGVLRAVGRRCAQARSNALKCARSIGNGAQWLHKVISVCRLAAEGMLTAALYHDDMVPWDFNLCALRL